MRPESSLRLLILCLLAIAMARPALCSPDSPAEPFEDEKGSTLLVSGSIVDREEIWDRRSNPLMGRPDFLKEIRLVIGSPKVLRGSLPRSTHRISVRIRGQKQLLAYKFLSVGMSGEFELSGEGPTYDLVAAKGMSKPSPSPEPTQKPRPRPSPEPQEGPGRGGFPENVNGRKLKASPSLQDKVLSEISGRYHMREARIVYLTSFSGPMPPEGGYLYWGVTGKVKGLWKVWQPGYRDELREGSGLIDPKRYQK